MQQVTEDVFIIKVATGNEQIELRLNSDCDGSEMVRHFANIMRMMTFTRTFHALSRLKNGAMAKSSFQNGG